MPPARACSRSAGAWKRRSKTPSACSIATARAADIPRLALILAFLFASAAGSAHAGESLLRLGAARGWDGNVGEAMESRLRTHDGFIRLQLDAAPPVLRFASFRTALRGRGLIERYDDIRAESRAQGEASIEVARRVRSVLLWGTGRLTGRTYPDSLRRDIQRGSWSLGAGVPFRSGDLRATLAQDVLDFRGTSWFDRRSGSFRLEYDRPAGERLDLEAAVSFEWSRYGRPALKRIASTPDLEIRGRQHDRGRELRLGASYLRAWLFDAAFTWQSISSNSFGYSVGRLGVEGGVSGWLPGDVLLQLRARAESVSYDDPGLDRFFLYRRGEDNETGDDNNSLLLGLRRPLARGLALESRLSWFRNESLLVGSFYEKVIGSFGIVWTPVGASDS